MQLGGRWRRYCARENIPGFARRSFRKERFDGRSKGYRRFAFLNGKSPARSGQRKQGPNQPTKAAKLFVKCDFDKRDVAQRFAHVRSSISGVCSCKRRWFLGLFPPEISVRYPYDGASFEKAAASQRRIIVIISLQLRSFLTPRDPAWPACTTEDYAFDPSYDGAAVIPRYKLFFASISSPFNFPTSISGFGEDSRAILSAISRS